MPTSDLKNAVDALIGVAEWAIDQGGAKDSIGAIIRLARKQVAAVDKAARGDARPPLKTCKEYKGWTALYYTPRGLPYEGRVSTLRDARNAHAIFKVGRATVLFKKSRLAHPKTLTIAAAYQLYRWNFRKAPVAEESRLPWRTTPTTGKKGR